MSVHPHSHPAPRRKKPPKFTAEVLVLTLKNLQKPKVLLLIPLTVFNGIEQAFAIGIYTKAYVGCGLGIAHIGYVMTTLGVCDAICSLVFGPLIRMFGRMPLFVFGAVMNILMIMTLMVWPLNPGDRALFNVVAGVWGMADSVWNTQVQGFWVGLTGRASLEVAFANYRFWMSAGMAIGFFVTRFTTVNSYLVFSFVLLLVGVLGYFATEMMDTIIVSGAAGGAQGLVFNVDHLAAFRLNSTTGNRRRKRWTTLRINREINARLKRINPGLAVAPITPTWSA